MATTNIHVFARWKVKEGYMRAVIQLLKDAHSKTILEKGNLFYMIHQSQADANTLVLFEGYVDAAAQQAHTNSEHFKKVIVEQIIPLLEEREVTLAIPMEV